MRGNKNWWCGTEIPPFPWHRGGGRLVLPRAASSIGTGGGEQEG